MKMTFKDFFLENRDRNFFAVLSTLIEEQYNETYSDKLSPFEQISKLALYVLWKKFDYTIFVVSSQKISKKNIAYDFFCSAILKELPIGFDRAFVSRIVNVMVDLGILTTYETEEDYHGEKTLFNIKHVFVGISEKELETFEAFKDRVQSRPNFSGLVEDGEGYLRDLYYRSIIRSIQP